ncbi:MAG: IS3 family transposase [Pedobacter sp.]|nr:MAG: IS3 family transposase [Pedobacter sp.]
MKEMYPSVGLEKICRLFGKTRQAYYDHSWRNDDHRMQEGLIIDLVKNTRKSLPKTGGLKLMYMLKDDFAAHNIFIGRDSFFTLLKKHDLLVRRRKRYAVTTDSNHPYKKWPDLVKGLEVKASEQLWVSDITYLKTTEGFVYLSLITDAYSRKIVGYHVSQNLKAQGCLIALNKAIGSRRTNRPLIHHSDRGIQYCCEPYVSLLQQNGISISMTQSGSPYDNAVAERVNGILKTELQLDDTFSNYGHAVAGVHKAIDAYNRLRPHMSISKLTPDQAHHSTQNPLKTWKRKQYCKAKAVLLSTL